MDPASVVHQESQQRRRTHGHFDQGPQEEHHLRKNKAQLCEADNETQLEVTPETEIACPSHLENA